MYSIDKICANIKEEMDAQENNTMDKFASIIENATTEEKIKMKEMLTDPAENEETNEPEEENEEIE